MTTLDRGHLRTIKGTVHIRAEIYAKEWFFKSESALSRIFLVPLEQLVPDEIPIFQCWDPDCQLKRILSQIIFYEYLPFSCVNIR
jgi:hypothetical protein